MLKVLTTVSGEVQADLLEARLRGAGIPCQRGPRTSRFSGRDMLVEQEHLDRAREVLAEADGGFDEEELARLSEEAGQRYAQENSAAAQPKVDPDAIEARDAVGAPTPTSEHRLRHAIGRFAKRETDISRDPFGR